MQLQKKGMKEEKCKGMLIRPEDKRYLIAIHLRLFELWVKFKTSVQKNSTSSSVWKKILTQEYFWHLGMVTEKFSNLL